MIDRTNVLNEPYNNYQFRRVGKLASQVHNGSARLILADKIVTRCSQGRVNSETIRRANHALSIMGDLRRV